MAVLAVDAAHWPFPFGWLYVAVLGNEVASVLAFAAGFAVGRRHLMHHFDRVIRRLDHLTERHDELHTKVSAIISHHDDIPEARAEGSPILGEGRED